MTHWGAEKPTRKSPLSSAVFGTKSLSQEGQEPAAYPATSTPMSAPVAFSDKIFDFSEVRNALAHMRHQPPSPTGSWESNSSEGMAAVSPKHSPRLPQRSATLSCFSCRNREVCAALVPCGHNLFCFPCAQQISSTHGNCPVCNTQVTTVLRLYN